MATKGGIPQRDIGEFCRQFAAMHRAGVNIMDILATLTTQSENEWFRTVLTSARRDVEMGRSLAFALSRFPGDFSPFFIQMVRRGEVEGVLDEVLLSLSQHVDRGPEMMLGQPTAGAGISYDVDVLVAKLRRLFVGGFMVVGIVCLAVGLFWRATQEKFLRLSPDYLGPNLVLLVGGLLLVMSFIFTIYRPPRVARCSFCGRSEEQAGELVAGEGVWICESCITVSVRQLRQRGAAGRVAPPVPDTTEEKVLEL